MNWSADPEKSGRETSREFNHFLEKCPRLLTGPGERGRLRGPEKETYKLKNMFPLLARLKGSRVQDSKRKVKASIYAVMSVTCRWTLKILSEKKPNQTPEPTFNFIAKRTC